MKNPGDKHIFPSSNKLFKDDKGNQKIIYLEKEYKNIIFIPSELPIEEYKYKIQNEIRKSQVVIINGNTGCGKSTQIPKYILEICIQDKIEPKIICTQPRRLAAINIAKRVKEELKIEQNSRMVGYQVGLNAKANVNTKILFVTTGIFLQRLVHKEEIHSFTHIIFDEVHERDLNIDFAMVAMKYILKIYPNLKLILMSASFDVSLFAHYFSESSIQSIELNPILTDDENKTIEEDNFKNSTWEDADYNSIYFQTKTETNSRGEKETPTIKQSWIKEDKIEKFLYPWKKEDQASIIEIRKSKYSVEVIYLNAIEIYAKINPGVHEIFNSKVELEKKFTKYHPKFFEEILNLAVLLVVDLIHFENILKVDEYNSSKKSILIFVPGYREIMDVIESIKLRAGERAKEFRLFPLHSSLPDDEQNAIFTKVENNERKIIVATNIAESSITIPDLEIVIDFCLSKESFFNSTSRNERLELTWSSKASCQQRTGRAGRVKNGFAFRLIPQSFYQALDEFNLPEMQRSSLDKIILQIKQWDKYELKQILTSSINPPSLIDIDKAVLRLKEAGALKTIEVKNLDRVIKKDKITPLGELYCSLPCDIIISKLFLYGMLFGCMYKCIIIGCILMQNKPIFHSSSQSDIVNGLSKKISFSYQLYSDPILYLNIYLEWTNKFCKTFESKNGEQFLYLDRFKSKEEKAFATLQGINLSVLKEAFYYVNEITKRFSHLGFSKETIYKEHNVEIRVNVLALRLAIAAAFYPKYMKPIFKYGETMKRYLFNELNEEDIYSIYVKNIEFDPNQIAQNINTITGDNPKVKKVFERYIFTFKKLKARDNICNALKLGYLGNQDKSYNSFNPSKNIPKYTLISNLQVNLFDVINSNKVDIDSDSLNYGTIEFPKDLNDVAYIAFDYIEKKDRIISNCITRIEGVQMISHLLFLIFSPEVFLFTNTSGSRYEGMKIENYLNPIYFPYYLSNSDIKEINGIRTCMNQLFCNPLSNTFYQPDLILNKIITLFGVSRLKKPYSDRLENVLFGKVKEEQNDPQKDKKINDNIPELFKTELNPRQIIFSKIEMNSKMRQDKRFFTQNGVKELEEEYKKIMKRKSEIILNIEQSLRASIQVEPIIICKECNNQVSTLNNLNLPFKDSNPNNQDIIYVKLNCVFDLKPCVVLPRTPNEFMNRHKIPNILFCSCINGHIICFKHKNDYYFTNYSNLKILLPENQEREWNLRILENNFSEIKKESSILSNPEKRKERIYECPICEIQLKGPENYSKHLNGLEHKENYEEFMQY